MSIPVQVVNGGIAYVYPDPSRAVTTLGKTAVFPNAREIPSDVPETGLLTSTSEREFVTTSDVGCAGILYVDATGVPTWTMPVPPPTPVSIANGGTGGDVLSSGGYGWIKTAVTSESTTLVVDDATQGDAVAIAVTADVANTDVAFDIATGQAGVMSLSNFSASPLGAIEQNPDLFTAPSRKYMVDAAYVSEVGSVIQPTASEAATSVGGTDYGPYIFVQMDVQWSNLGRAQLMKTASISNGDGTATSLEIVAFFVDSEVSMTFVGAGEAANTVAPMSAHNIKVVPSASPDRITLQYTTTYPYSSERAEQFEQFDWEAHVMLVAVT